MKNLNKEKVIKIIYWLTIVSIFVFQSIFTLNSMSQIRYEELAESVRNVYWLNNRLIYDGISSNIGLYSSFLITYKLFGFSLFTAKFFRLALYFISIFCLSLLLKKYIGIKNSILPLIAIGLSPTFLFFTTIQTSYGIDLQYLPIILYLILTINVKKKKEFVLKQILIGVVSMVAWMSYPTFVYYLPAIGLLYIRQLKKQIKFNLFFIKNIFLITTSFITPLIFAYFYIKNNKLLIYDSVTNSGIFRGAGSFEITKHRFALNIKPLFVDFFNKGNSYYFEIKNSDFSNFYPILVILIVSIIILILFFKKRKYRLIILITLITFLINFFVANFTVDQSGRPGIRRNTGILASFYVFYVLSWHYILTKKISKKWLKLIIIFIFLLLPIHHLLIYPDNLSHLKDESPNRYGLWLGGKDNPSMSLKKLTNTALKEELRLSCKNDDGKDNFCRYNEVYAAVAGSCSWNKLNCKNIVGYDDKTQSFIPVSIETWEKYYWPH